MAFPEEFEIVGNIRGHDVYTTGVAEDQENSIIGVWHELPRKEELFDSFEREWVYSGSDSCSSWLTFQWDSWGASDVFGEDEIGAIRATIGHNNGRPIMLDVILATGDDAGAEDVEEFIYELYDVVLDVLHDECLRRCNGHLLCRTGLSA